MDHVSGTCRLQANGRTMGGMMTALARFILPLLLFLAPLSAAQAQTAAQCSTPPPAAAAAPAEPRIERAREGWWADNRWRYPDDGAAEEAFRALTRWQSAWPEWHQSHVVTLPVGLRFQMVLSPGQLSECPGGFGTFDRIRDLEFVRTDLAVKLAWKPEIDRVVTYEIRYPLLVDVGMVGPQIDDRADRYLPGGASQFQMLVPADGRMSYLRVVEVQPIRR